MLYKKGVLKNLAKFTGKHLCQSISFNKVTGRAELLNRLFPTGKSAFILWTSLSRHSRNILLQEIYLLKGIWQLQKRCIRFFFLFFCFFWRRGRVVWVCRLILLFNKVIFIKKQAVKVPWNYFVIQILK